MSNGARRVRQRQQRILSGRGFTSSDQDFSWLCRNTRDRVGIVTEGDSWFAYPRENIVFGRNANIIDHICSTTAGTDTANILRLASNGDEATEIISGSQKHALAKILKKDGTRIQLLLFSAGGNDVVGKWDMERLLNPYNPGDSAQNCVRLDRLKRKVQRVMLAYQELIELRDEYAPGAVIVTHTYDEVTPSKKGAKFLWGAIKTAPWIYPYLVQKNIPEHLHLPISNILLESLAKGLIALSNRPKYKQGFRVVNTRGTLRTGHQADWKNEIHPTSSGFKRIAKKIYAEMRALQPSLPPFS